MTKENTLMVENEAFWKSGWRRARTKHLWSGSDDENGNYIPSTKEMICDMRHSKAIKRLRISKLKASNEIVKNTISKNYDKNSWRFIDFVEEDRFMIESVGDKNIEIDSWSVEEIAEYALEQINVCHPTELSPLHGS